MGLFAEPWLREARDHIKLVAANTPDVKKTNPVQFDKLAEAVEKAIKAALVENHGSVPRQLDHQNLVSICQTTGVWDVLPPALRGLVQEVQSFRSTNSPATVAAILRRTIAALFCCCSWVDRLHGISRHWQRFRIKAPDG